MNSKTNSFSTFHHPPNTTQVFVQASGVLSDLSHRNHHKIQKASNSYMIQYIPYRS